MDEREERYERELAEEAATWEHVRALVRELVAIAAPVWHWGDGVGGAVLEELNQAAADAGLSSRHAWEWAPASRVQLLAERDGWECHYCHVTLAGSPTVPLPQLDHVVPRSAGGSNALDNLVLACGHCNASKGALPVDVFMARRGSTR